MSNSSAFLQGNFQAEVQRKQLPCRSVLSNFTDTAVRWMESYVWKG